MTLKILGLILVSQMAFAAVPTPEKELKAVVFDATYPMEARWDAYHKVIRKNKNESLPMARKALKSHDWFLREAGLKTFVALNPDEAKNIARGLFQNDPSLLVRVQALSAIKIMNDKDSEKLLWTALNDRKNFRGDQSLWIRPQIVATLMEFQIGQKGQFQKLVDDKDPQVQRLARIAIAKF
jgi:hypothetical protein